MNIQLDLAETIDHHVRAVRVDAVANRAHILEVAEQLFAENGVANVCMAEIARVAGVGKGTLYRHFANKGEVCLSLMDSQMREFQDASLVWMQEMNQESALHLDILKGFLDRLVYFTDRHMPLLYEVQHHSDEVDRGTMTRPHFWQYMTVHALLSAALRAGEITDDLDVSFMAEALLAPLAAALFRFQVQELGFSLARISAGLQTVVNGLGRL